MRRHLTVPLACAAPFAAGCTGSSFYTTPRTAEPMKAYAVLAPEYVISPRDPGVKAFGPSPHVAARLGLTERLEAGVHLDSPLVPLAAGLDLKWNPLRTDVFDLALGARATGRVALVGGGGRESVFFDSALFHVPIFLGVNAGPVTFVATPGVTSLVDGGGLSTGYRAGGGVQLRFSSLVAIQPEITWVRGLVGPRDFELVTAGLGFLFGDWPKVVAP
ncbi:MAG: hypothetical protein KF850_08545 [Labilithrix sp.]|nr:hypothetical protein [Labilithrix sp.]